MSATVSSRREVPRTALTIAEACESLGVSYDTWRAHIECDIALVRIGTRKLVPLRSIEAWLDANAAKVLER
jgi:excisionase family DNA binding protein